MSRTLTAHFASQFEAASAADKLFSLGLPRDQLLLHVDERGMQTPSSSWASTTVIRETQADAEDVLQADADRTRKGRQASEALRPPISEGYATLAIGLPCALSEDDVSRTLTACGALDMVQSDAVAPAPNPAMRPTVDIANATDVERAIDASRGGDALGRTAASKNASGR